MRKIIALLAIAVLPTLPGRAQEAAPVAPATNPPVEAVAEPETKTEKTEDKPVAPPALSITKAATLAEAELEKLGLAQTHFVRSLNFYPDSKAGAARYAVRIEPPLPVSGSSAENARTNLAVFMDGSVKMVTIETSPRRVKRIVQ